MAVLPAGARLPAAKSHQNRQRGQSESGTRFPWWLYLNSMCWLLAPKSPGFSISGARAASAASSMCWTLLHLWTNDCSQLAKLKCTLTDPWPCTVIKDAASFKLCVARVKLLDEAVCSPAWGQDTVPYGHSFLRRKYIIGELYSTPVSERCVNWSSWWSQKRLVRLPRRITNVTASGRTRFSEGIRGGLSPSASKAVIPCRA